MTDKLLLPYVQPLLLLLLIFNLSVLLLLLLGITGCHQQQ
jgi:hypothetical protein